MVQIELNWGYNEHQKMFVTSQSLNDLRIKSNDDWLKFITEHVKHESMDIDFLEDYDFNTIQVDDLIEILMVSVDSYESICDNINIKISKIEEVTI